jgi:hypothetical protein
MIYPYTKFNIRSIGTRKTINILCANPLLRYRLRSSPSLTPLICQTTPYPKYPTQFTNSFLTSAAHVLTRVYRQKRQGTSQKPRDFIPLFEGFENALTCDRGLHSYTLSPGDDNYSFNRTSTKKNFPIESRDQIN